MGAVYSPAVVDAAIRAAWGSVPPWPYLSPPALAWLLVPFALLPFSLAFAVWLGASAVGLAWAAWIAGGRPLYVLSVLGFLPVFVALGSGQVAPLIVLALVWAVRLEAGGRWALAGVLLAVVAVKPQLGLMVPVAVLASGRWRPVAVAAAIAVVLAVLTLAALGVDGVRRWLDAVHQFSGVGYFLRWSLAPLLGETGWAVAALVTALLVAAAGRHWRQNGLAVLGAGLLGSILVNHYLTPSDLVVLLVPVWALARAGGRAAALGAVLWAAAWLALFFPILLIGAEALVLLAMAAPAALAASALRLAPAHTS